MWPVRIASISLFLLTVAMNYFIGIKNQDNYRLYVTPPGVFFAIWGLIYTSMAIANVYNLVKNSWSLSAHVYVAVNNFLLILWLAVFDIGTDTAVCSAFVILVLTTIIGLKFWT